jgi:arylsulfatase A-like enzyme
MAIRFVTEQRDGPWLLSVNPFDPHAPFDAPPEYLARVDAAALPLPLFRESDLERQKAFAAIDQQTKVAADPRIRRHIAPVAAGDHDAIASKPGDYDALAVKANYYAMIMLIDDQLKRIVDALQDTGQLDNTIIVYMSDHGELLGDHGLILKGCRFFEGLVRVPLIFSWPEGIERGLISNALVETIDVAPAARGCRAARPRRCRAVPAADRWRRRPASPPAPRRVRVLRRVGGHPDHTHGDGVRRPLRPWSITATRSANSTTCRTIPASSTTCGTTRTRAT